MTATSDLDALCSVPRLLERNARDFGAMPAYREKEYGIWQSWTWSEASEEVNALALGLLDLGLNAGDHVAIIGGNRPYFYWAMVAAQMRSSAIDPGSLKTPTAWFSSQA